MKKQFAFLIILLLTACTPTPQRPPNAEEQLATIAVKTQVAGQLGTIVAQTLTAQPPTFTPIPSSATTTPVVGAEAVPTGDAPIVSEMLACSPQDGLVYFRIDPNTIFRNWHEMVISINQTQVICSEPPGDPNTLACELPPHVTFPASVTFGIGDGIAGYFPFHADQCVGSEFPPTLSLIFTATNAQNVNLRTNPGLLFTVSRVMAQGTHLQVLSISPGGDWAFVRTDEGINGWVDLNFVRPFPQAQLGIIEPSGVQRISGTVLNGDGVPMNGITFAITQGNKRTEAKTNEDGTFHAYLPPSAAGAWTVGYTGVAMISNAITGDCLQNVDLCGKPSPISVEVTLPNVSTLSFVWNN
jgi:hypothetical protein